MGSLATELESIIYEKELFLPDPHPFLQNEINPSYFIATALPQNTDIQCRVVSYC